MPWFFGSAAGGGAGAGAAGAGAADAAAAGAAGAGAAGSAGLLSSLGNAALTAGSWLGNTALDTALKSPVGQLGQGLYSAGQGLANLAQGNYGVGADLPQGVTGAGPASPLQPSESSVMFGGRATPQSFDGAPTASGIAASRPAGSASAAPLAAGTGGNDVIDGILQGFSLDQPINDLSGQGTQVKTPAPPLGQPNQMQAPIGGGAGNRIGVGINGMLTWMPSTPQIPQAPGMPGGLPPLGAYRGG